MAGLVSEYEGLNCAGGWGKNDLAVEWGEEKVGYSLEVAATGW